jgi:hypothetical protein
VRGDLLTTAQARVLVVQAALPVPRDIMVLRAATGALESMRSGLAEAVAEAPAALAGLGGNSSAALQAFRSRLLAAAAQRLFTRGQATVGGGPAAQWAPRLSGAAIALSGSTTLVLLLDRRASLFYPSLEGLAAQAAQDAALAQAGPEYACESAPAPAAAPPPQDDARLLSGVARPLRLAVYMGAARANVTWVSPDRSQVHVLTPPYALLCGGGGGATDAAAGAGAAAAQASGGAAASGAAQNCGFQALRLVYEPEDAPPAAASPAPSPASAPNGTAAARRLGAAVPASAHDQYRLPPAHRRLQGAAADSTALAWLSVWLSGAGAGVASAGDMNALLAGAAIPSPAVECPPWCPSMFPDDAVPLAVPSESAGWAGTVVPVSAASVDGARVPAAVVEAAAASAAAAARQAGGFFYTLQCVGFTDFTTGACTNASHPDFPRCGWRPAAGGECAPCPKNAVCPGGPFAYPAAAGLWVANEFSGDIEPCAPPALQRCLGWEPTLAAVRCGAGYRQFSAGCLACDEGFFQATSTGACTPCPTSAGLDALLTSLLLFAGTVAVSLAAVLALTLLVAKLVGGSVSGGRTRVLDLLLWLVVVLQVLAQVGKTATAGLPEAVARLFRLLAVFQFEDIALPSACWRLFPFTAEAVQCTVVLACSLGLWLWIGSDSPACQRAHTQLRWRLREACDARVQLPASASGCVRCTRRVAVACRALQLRCCTSRARVRRKTAVGRRLQPVEGWPPAPGRPAGDVALPVRGSGGAHGAAAARVALMAAAPTAESELAAGSRATGGEEAPESTAASVWASASTRGVMGRRCGRIRLSAYLPMLGFSICTLLYALVCNSVLRLLACSQRQVSALAYSTLDRTLDTPFEQELRASGALLRNDLLSVLVLANNPTFVCYSGSHLPAAALAWVTLLLYCVGYPLWTLLWARARIRYVAARAFKGLEHHNCAAAGAAAGSPGNLVDTAPARPGLRRQPGAQAALQASTRGLTSWAALEAADAGAMRALLARAPIAGRVALVCCGRGRTLRAFAFSIESPAARVARLIAARRAARSGAASEPAAIKAVGAAELEFASQKSSGAPASGRPASARLNKLLNSAGRDIFAEDAVEAGQLQGLPAPWRAGGEASQSQRRLTPDLQQLHAPSRSVVKPAPDDSVSTVAADATPSSKSINVQGQLSTAGVSREPLVALPGLLQAAAMDGSDAVAAEPALSHFAGTTYRPSLCELRQADMGLLAALALIQVFWPTPSDEGGAVARGVVNVLVLLVAAWHVATRSPFLAGDGWKGHVKVGSLLLAALATALTHYTLSMSLRYADALAAAHATFGVDAAVLLAAGVSVEDAASYASHAQASSSLSYAVFAGCVLLVATLAVGFWSGTIRGARLDHRLRLARSAAAAQTLRTQAMLAAVVDSVLRPRSVALSAADTAVGFAGQNAGLTAVGGTRLSSRGVVDNPLLSTSRPASVRAALEHSEPRAVGERSPAAVRPASARIGPRVPARADSWRGGPLLAPVAAGQPPQLLRAVPSGDVAVAGSTRRVVLLEAATLSAAAAVPPPAAQYAARAIASEALPHQAGQGPPPRRPPDAGPAAAAGAATRDDAGSPVLRFGTEGSPVLPRPATVRVQYGAAPAHSRLRPLSVRDRLQRRPGAPQPRDDAW